MSLGCSPCLGRRKEKNPHTDSNPNQSHPMESNPSQEPPARSNPDRRYSIESILNPEPDRRCSIDNMLNPAPPSESNTDDSFSIESSLDLGSPASGNPNQGPSNTADASNARDPRPKKPQNANEKENLGIGEASRFPRARCFFMDEVY